MSFSEFEQKRIQRILTRFCESEVPEQERSQRRLTYGLKGDIVLLRESRAEGDGSGRWVAARSVELRRNPVDRTWSAYVTDPSGTRQPHALLDGWENFEDLLDQLSGEPSAIVWG